MKKNELKIYGVHACRAVWEKNPERIIRAYVIEKRLKEMSDLLRWCARSKRAYHVVTEAELEKITTSVHHDGVCLLVKMPVSLQDDDFLRIIQSHKEKPSCLLYMDGVGNPHNVGAIIRTCAHFGISHILGAKEQLPALTPSACRIAEGGVESVELVYLKQPSKVLKELQKVGYQLVATSSYEGSSLYEHNFSSKTVIVMGAEMVGVSKGLGQLCSHALMIPGSGKVESLNVSVATGVFLGEWYRQSVPAKAGK